MRTAWRGALGTFAFAVCLLVIGSGIAAAVGYRPVVILTGSMGATAPPGALAIAAPTGSVEVGDVLVMRTAGRSTVTHRVVSIATEDGALVATTRGDANPDIDPERYQIGEQELTVRWVVPGLGRALMEIRSPALGLALSGFVVFALVVGALRRIWVPAERRDRPVAPRAALDGASGRRARVAAAIATVLGVSVAGGGVALSLYAGVGAVGANEFSTLECYDARLDSVQTGHATSTTNGTTTVTIDPVAPDRSFLLFSVSSTGNEPDESIAMGRLASATEIEFVRASDDAPPGVVEIEWSVVDYACGVSVQRGTATGNGSDHIDVAIDAVDAATSFVVHSGLPVAGTADLDGATLTTAALVTPTTLRIAADTPIPNGSLQAWQVVTFADPADAAVQTVSGTLAAGVDTITLALPTAVVPSSTIVLAGSRSSNPGVSIGDRLVRVRLIDASTVEVSRQVTTGSVAVSVQVVELREGSTVQRGVLDLAATEVTTTATIPPVSVDRSTALSTVLVPGSASGGSTALSGDDALGEASVRVHLADARTVEVTRGASSAPASFAWQVVTWGGPSWVDLQSPFRRRIDVTAGSVVAPDGYTTSLAFDHAAMVADGMSLADGSDIRVWRHDGVSWTELHRVVDDTSAWDRPDTTVWFRTQEPIAAGQTVTYWMYFGNPSPSPALDDPAGVWLVSEGFDDGTLGAFEDRTGGTGWYRALPWSRRITLTVPAAATASDLANEAVLVRLTDPDLAAHAQSDGADVRFVAADGTTPLVHELEAYDPATGTLTAWVRVPTVTAAAPTVLHLLYGAADAPDQADAAATWVDQTAVWQLAADPVAPEPALDDSGPEQHDGVALADASRSLTDTGPGGSLDGSLDRFESAPFLLDGAALTVSTWFRADALGGTRVIAAQGDPAVSGTFDVGVVGSAPAAARFRLRVGDALVEVAGGAVDTTGWHHVVGTWDGTNARLYLDGAAVGSTAGIGTVRADGPAPVVIGADPSGASAFDGTIGQVRVDDSAWGPIRIAFQHRNLADPAATVVAAAASGGTWLDQGDWATRRPLVVESDLVAGPLVDYPLLVQLTDAGLGATAQADGDDIVFTAADGTTRLDHQIEEWDPHTGALTAWVRLPTLGDSDDTVVFLYLDNPTARDQQDPVGVWGPDADLVVIG